MCYNSTIAQTSIIKKGAIEMDDMLKKYYYSELCEMNTPAVYSDEANKASYKKRSFTRSCGKTSAKRI